MAQNPVLTSAQCSSSGNTYTVRVGWQLIQEATYFVAVVFDPSNNQVARKVVGGPLGASSAMLTNVALTSTVNYTVAVAQSDQSGNPTSAYSPPFNLLQQPLTNITTVNDLDSIVVSATLPAVGLPAGMSINLMSSGNTLLATASVTGSSGTLIPPQPLDPTQSYYLLVAPTSNQTLSIGPNQRADLQMTRPVISAISYDGDNLTVSTATALPTGSTLKGVLIADGTQLAQATGSNVSVSIPVVDDTLDLSKRYSCTLRGMAGNNAGPASVPIEAVVTPPQFESAYYVGNHIGGRWTVPPVAPMPTGASIAAIVNGGIAGTPQTTIGYRGDIDLSGVTVANMLKFQANSVFGVAKGPPASVNLPYTAPVITSVAVADGTITVGWQGSPGAPGYRLYLNDSTGKPVGHVDAGGLSGTLALPFSQGAVYSVSVQPFGTNSDGIAISGPVSAGVAALVAVPVATSTSYDGTNVTVNWTAPQQTAGITGYTAELLHADTLVPAGFSKTAGAGDTSCQIAAALTSDARLVAAVRATGTNSTGNLGPAVEVLSVKPVVTATDASATSLHVAWDVAPDPSVTGYTVTISDGGSPGTHQTFQTTGTVLDTPNTLTAAQVNVRVCARSASATGADSAPAYLFGTKPSYYPQNANTNGLYLVRSNSNQPAPADIVLAFPNVFTAAPATLPSAGIFTLEANSASTLLPYKLTIPANSIAWSFDPASRATLSSNFLDFLKKMEMPDGSNVLIKPGALAIVRQTVALGLPLLFSEQLKFMYGFNPDAQTGGYVDLVPGMRLRVDTAVQQITPPNNNQMGYVPTGSATYDIQSYAQGTALNLGFNGFLSAIVRPSVPTPLVEPNAGGGGVVDLYTATGRQPYFRLLYPSTVHGPKFTGLVDQANLPVILGATTYNGLVAATNQYVAQGNFTGLTNIFPFYFRGRSALTPEVSASLNGQRFWLALGSTVENLIAQAGSQPSCLSAAVGGFAMRRSIGGLTDDLNATSLATTAVVTNRVRLEYPSASFQPPQSGYFDLPLFCGDDIRLDQGG
ncbi:hypothetical protein [Rhizobium terrae]|uniref:hypothetical protein n=1 Tax=Rhizobium terrae TaxID=2171756 RepID=UPI000E3BFBB4|nr:hypothetical protein [Rhizobium terrae]